MSVVGKSVGDTRRSEAFQPVSQVNPLTGVAAGSGATTDGSTPITGSNGTSAASSTNPIPVKAAPAVPLGFQQIVGAVASTGLTVPPGATYAIIQPVSQAIAWRDDGVAPTATIGMTVPSGGELLYDGTLSTFRFIQVAATVTVNISYYR